jgi:hypothetical protein
MDAKGYRYIDHIPDEIARKKDRQQMQIELIN